MTVKERIVAVTKCLKDLGDELTSDRELDRVRLQLLASCVAVAVERLESDLTFAVYDMEAALKKIWGQL